MSDEQNLEQQFHVLTHELLNNPSHTVEDTLNTVVTLFSIGDTPTDTLLVEFKNSQGVEMILDPAIIARERSEKAEGKSRNSNFEIKVHQILRWQQFRPTNVYKVPLIESSDPSSRSDSVAAYLDANGYNSQPFNTGIGTGLYKHN